MAKRRRKRPVSRSSSATLRSRRKPVRRTKSSGRMVHFIVPVVLMLGIVFCLGVLAWLGLQTVTASDFFDAKKIEITGVSRASKEDIESIVRSNTAMSGVWNADLAVIKESVDKLVYVKTASVSRVLPHAVAVNVVERVPLAVVRIEGADFWVDEDGVVLSRVAEGETRPPFAMLGWNREKSDAAREENRERVKLFVKMLEEWREFDLANRVATVNLADLRDLQASVEHSGNPVVISFSGNDKLKEQLKRALEILGNRKGEIEEVIFDGSKESIVRASVNR